jgi:hypothetical protein
VNSDRLFSPDSSTNKTDCLDITELLLKVVLNTIKLTLIINLTKDKFSLNCLCFYYHSPWNCYKQEILYQNVLCQVYSISTNKTDCFDITELLLKVVLNTIILTLIIAITMWYNFQQIVYKPLICDIIKMVMPLAYFAK